jgi:phosphoadenosine phosphosulfate reductase
MADTLEIDVDTLSPDTLNQRFEGSGTRAMLQALLTENADKRIAVISSFGANSVVLLHLVAGIDPSLPVLFVDTGKLFAETIRYRDEIAERLGLTDVRVIGPEPSALAARDPAGALWISDTQACCAVRKVKPFALALEDFDIWISGRKRYQGGRRAELPLFEAEDIGKAPRLKVNPLAHWTKGDIDIYRTAFSLPQHTLVAKGYASIGCQPCTSPVAEDEDERAGRWRGSDKTECGIHVADDMGGLP